MISYEYDETLVRIEEQKNGDDVDVWLRFPAVNAEAEKAVKRIRDEFEANEVMTDVLFYAHSDGYQWVVRNDYYPDFLMQLFKHKLITSLRWTD
ncbi:hypothetical protein [Paenibacillus silviterrae]|uniref:hypothetical protein n=1 Tax=Paenibacillus silviterrae TaxID=3242194 RepID=UPI002543600E|nr:hypothetical protein [Paenibacillus chinjuensis]